MDGMCGTVEERLIALRIDSIYISNGKFSLVGPYSDSFRGNTILEAIEDAERQLNRPYKKGV